VIQRVQLATEPADLGGEAGTDILRTRIAGRTIGANVVAGHVSDKVLQGLLMGRLPALSGHSRHVAS